MDKQLGNTAGSAASSVSSTPSGTGCPSRRRSRGRRASVRPVPETVRDDSRPSRSSSRALRRVRSERRPARARTRKAGATRATRSAAPGTSRRRSLDARSAANDRSSVARASSRRTRSHAARGIAIAARSGFAVPIAVRLAARSRRMDLGVSDGSGRVLHRQVAQAGATPPHRERPPPPAPSSELCSYTAVGRAAERLRAAAGTRRAAASAERRQRGRRCRRRERAAAGVPTLDDAARGRGDRRGIADDRFAERRSMPRRPRGPSGCASVSRRRTDLEQRTAASFRALLGPRSLRCGRRAASPAARRVVATEGGGLLPQAGCTRASCGHSRRQREGHRPRAAFPGGARHRAAAPRRCAAPRRRGAARASGAGAPSRPPPPPPSRRRRRRSSVAPSSAVSEPPRGPQTVTLRRAQPRFFAREPPVMPNAAPSVRGGVAAAPTPPARARRTAAPNAPASTTVMPRAPRRHGRHRSARSRTAALGQPAPRRGRSVTIRCSAPRTPATGRPTEAALARRRGHSTDQGRRRARSTRAAATRRLRTPGLLRRELLTQHVRSCARVRSAHPPPRGQRAAAVRRTPPARARPPGAAGAPRAARRRSRGERRGDEVGVFTGKRDQRGALGDMASSSSAAWASGSIAASEHAEIRIHEGRDEGVLVSPPSSFAVSSREIRTAQASRGRRTSPRRGSRRCSRLCRARSPLQLGPARSAELAPAAFRVQATPLLVF